MAFKVDASFLRFLTIGALGVRHVAGELRDLGFEPVELERYATSNKIWTTKIKRLRVPDLLCARTGIRIEIRAKTAILAGLPESLANLEDRLAGQYDPVAALDAEAAMDRFAAVKALPARPDLHDTAVIALDAMLAAEPDIRVALEAAGSAAAPGSKQGEDYLASLLARNAPGDDMSMEAILILSEIRTSFARQQLLQVADSVGFCGRELRQAAVWGLGKTGHCSYEDLVEFIGDDEQDVALHAIGAFGPDTPQPVISALTEVLLSHDTRKAAAASEVLRRIDNVSVLRTVLAVASAPPPGGDWALATLGRLSPDMVRVELSGTPLLRRLEPMLLTAPITNWLEGESTSAELAFLLKQDL